MNTREVIKILAERTGRSQAGSRTMYRRVIAVLRNELVSHNKFTIPGLGSLGVQERNHRKNYNPNLKTLVLLPRKIVTYFRPARVLKEMVNMGQDHEQ